MQAVTAKASGHKHRSPLYVCVVNHLEGTWDALIDVASDICCTPIFGDDLISQNS